MREAGRVEPTVTSCEGSTDDRHAREVCSFGTVDEGYWDAIRGTLGTAFPTVDIEHDGGQDARDRETRRDRHGVLHGPPRPPRGLEAVDNEGIGWNRPLGSSLPTHEVQDIGGQAGVAQRIAWFGQEVERSQRMCMRHAARIDMVRHEDGGHPLTKQLSRQCET